MQATEQHPMTGEPVIIFDVKTDPVNIHVSQHALRTNTCIYIVQKKRSYYFLSAIKKCVTNVVFYIL